MKTKKIILFVLSLVLMLSLYGAPKQARKNDSLIIYESPSLSAKAIGYLNEGESAMILESGETLLVDGVEAFWVKVRMNDGREGWALVEMQNEKSDHKVDQDYHFIIKRKGFEVTASDRGKKLTEKDLVDSKDPSVVLASFFLSYFSQGKEWKNFVDASGLHGKKEDLIDAMNEAYRESFSLPEEISITIDSKKFDWKTGYYTIKIGYSYNGEEGEGEDQVSMVQDEKSGIWFVVKLPR